MRSGSDVRYHGRDFSMEEIDLIRKLIESNGSMTRVDLSRRVCEELTWVKPDGGLKEMACRVAMLRMERDGLIRLPAPRTTNGNGRIKPAATRGSDPRLPVGGSAGELGSLDFEIVTRGTRSTAWNEFIERYHYLGYKPLAGAQIRYFVYAGGDLVALLGFGAAAWALGPRDEFIGWGRESREKGLPLIANNARFLIPPWVQVKNLASRILGHVARRIVVDWELRYGYRPVFLETCVEQGREGTCYKAANWQLLGETQGRGKLDRKHDHALSVKRIFVYPLSRDFREILRSGHCEAVVRPNFHREENTDGRRQPRTTSDAPRVE